MFTPEQLATLDFRSAQAHWKTGAYGKALLLFEKAWGRHAPFKAQAEKIILGNCWEAVKATPFNSELDAARTLFAYCRKQGNIRVKLLDEKQHLINTFATQKLARAFDITSALDQVEQECPQISDAISIFRDQNMKEPKFSQGCMRPKIDAVVAPFEYNKVQEGEVPELVSGLVLAFKEKPELSKYLGPMLGQYLYARGMGDSSCWWVRSVDFVVPVPLHRSRLAERGFNQASLLAKCMENSCCLPVLEDVAERVKNTLDLRQCGRAQRFYEMSGAFSVVDANMVRGRSVLIVDDVITTGATVRSLAEALRAAGAKSVCAAALCKAC